MLAISVTLTIKDAKIVPDVVDVNGVKDSAPLPEKVIEFPEDVNPE